jgi:hypothetical protein
MISEEKLRLLEEQITEKKKTVDFDTREFTIEFLVQKYLNKIDRDQNDIFVPEYQREFVWDDSRQSKLIESITLGLPIPIIFVAEDKNGRLEIVDGSQRIRTLAAFLTNELMLDDLEKLTEMNGLRYDDLPPSRKRKINNTAIRMIVLSDAATEEVRNDLFERINRGSDLLRNMEKRKGIYPGKFNEFIYKDCAKNKILERLAPLAKAVVKRQEHEELVLRFFALIDQYPRFRTHRKGIGSVLDEYMDEMNRRFNDSIKNEKKAQFESMLDFVENSFLYGFTRGHGKYVSRVFFEAISVGVYLALKENPDVEVRSIDIKKWLQDEYFYSLISGTNTHSPDRMRQRIEYVKSKILGH